MDPAAGENCRVTYTPDAYALAQDCTKLIGTLEATMKNAGMPALERVKLIHLILHSISAAFMRDAEPVNPDYLANQIQNSPLKEPLQNSRAAGIDRNASERTYNAGLAQVEAWRAMIICDHPIMEGFGQRLIQRNSTALRDEIAAPAIKIKH